MSRTPAQQAWIDSSIKHHNAAPKPRPTSWWTTPAAQTCRQTFSADAAEAFDTRMRQSSDGKKAWPIDRSELSE